MMPSSKIVTLSALLVAARACQDVSMVMGYTCPKAAEVLGCEGIAYGATQDDPTSLIKIECPVTCNNCPTESPTPGPTVAPTPPTSAPTSAPVAPSSSPTSSPTGSPTPCADTDIVMGKTCPKAAEILGCEGIAYGATQDDPTSLIKYECPETCGLCPTDAPTRSPTVSPTPPTEAPTPSPSSSPTYCRDVPEVMNLNCAKAAQLIGCESIAYGATQDDPTSFIKVECPISCGECPPMDYCHIDDVTCPTHPEDMNCKENVCDPYSGSCQDAVKVDGSLCDDNNPVTVYDTCTNGVCAGIDLCQGVTCNAIDQCHIGGICNPATGTCTTPEKADGTACNDNKALTENDVCTAGTCAGTEVISPDICASCVSADPCKLAECASDGLSCLPLTNLPNGDPCDIGDSTGTCEEGVCSAAESPTQPPSDADPLGSGKPSTSGGNLPIIVGAAAGATVLLAVVIVSVMMCKKKKADKEVDDYLRRASHSETWRGLPDNRTKKPASPSVVDMGQDRTGHARTETLSRMWNTAPNATDRTTDRTTEVVATKPGVRKYSV